VIRARIGKSATVPSMQHRQTKRAMHCGRRTA